MAQRVPIDACYRSEYLGASATVGGLCRAAECQSVEQPQMTGSSYLTLCLAFILPLTPAAAQRPGAAQSTYVYKPDGTRHCETSPGITLDSMAQELIRSGVPVQTRRKSHDGREGIALCGNPTGSINVYEIGESDIPRALELGFQRLDRSRLDPR